MPKNQRSSLSKRPETCYIQTYLSQRELGSQFSQIWRRHHQPANSSPISIRMSRTKSLVDDIMSQIAPFPSLDRGGQDSSLTLLNETEDNSDGSYDTFAEKEQVSDKKFHNPSDLNTIEDNMQYFASRRLPSVLQEHEYDLSGMDKVFSAVWLSERQIVLGTKCQNLVVMDVMNGKKTIVPSMNPIPIRTSADSITNTQCHGIHSICINPSRTLLAVGAGKADNSLHEFGIHIYSLPFFEPVASLYGHKDMVFSVSFLDDYNLVSGSRDKSIKIWKIAPFEYNTQESMSYPPTIKKYKPVHSETKHEQKVRDLVFDRATTQLFTLSTDGSVKIWDASNSIVTNSIPLEYTSETVCMALDQTEHFVSVGSQTHISIIDPRIGKIVHTFESLDNGWGVRSMTIHSSLLTVGGGLGRISFYDLRARNYLSWESSSDNKEVYLSSGSGWLCRDYMYQRNFQGVNVSNAVYSLVYDDTFGKLFIAGGPLQLNLKGSYAGLWK